MLYTEVMRQFWWLGALLLLGCGNDDTGSSGPGKTRVTPAPPGAPYSELSEWHLFDSNGKPAERVVPYEVVSPLWSDATSKYRYLFVPEGTSIGYDDHGVWKFPVGTVLVKTFAYAVDARDASSGERLLETRLLVHDPDGWAPYTYVYLADESKAVRSSAGANIPVSFIDSAGTSHDVVYSVPNTNMCRECHGLGATLDTLGGRTRQLNRDHDYGKGPENQIDHLAALGLFDATPPAAAERETLAVPSGSAPVGERARAYLDANCAHCHSEGRIASSSGLLLNFEKTGAETASASFGVCKTPTSAGGGTCGLVYDIVPGKPQESILMCRIASREPKVQMPPLGTQLVDDAGVKLLGEWIQSLGDPPCK